MMSFFAAGLFTIKPDYDLVEPRRADFLLAFSGSPGFRIDQIRFLQNLDIGRDCRLRHPKCFADLVDVERSAATQQPQNSHTNRRREPPDNFKLRFGIDVEKAANALFLR